MADIARIAGVDVSTVSRALAGNPRVAKKTRELIDQIVRDTGYVVNEAGRNLRDGRAYQVLVIVQDIAAPFYSDVVQGIVALFAEHDINILLGITLGRAKREDDLAKQLLSGGVDGIISLTGNAPQTISNTRDFNRKIVAISRPIPHENVACVTINNYAAAREVMEYLYSMGHRHIVHIGGPNHSETYRLRSAAYVDFMRDHCLDEQINVRSTNSFSDDIESGTAIMRSFLDDGIRPTAVFCATDELAVGAMAGKPIWIYQKMCLSSDLTTYSWLVSCFQHCQLYPSRVSRWDTEERRSCISRSTKMEFLQPRSCSSINWL